MPTGIPKSKGVVEALAKSNFVASDEQIETLARLNLTGLQQTDNVRGSYLKVLVAGVQKAIGKPAARGARKLSEAAEVLAQVHERYYAAVLKGITTPDVADDESLDRDARTARSLERNRRSNFARSAKSLVNKFIDSGGDVMTINATTVTKTELQSFVLSMRQKLQATGVTLEHKAQLAMARIDEAARELADEDKEAAVTLVSETMAKLTNLLSELGRDFTTKTLVAVKEHRPLKLGEGMFWPMGRAVAPQAGVQ